MNGSCRQTILMNGDSVNETKKQNVVGAEPWNESERQLLDSLTTPEKIQVFLDSIPYNVEITCRSPRRVMRDRRAHCFEGSMMAAAALERIGHPPWLVDMGAVRDDEHVIAVFRKNGGWGALAKSNCSGLRYRSPVYKSLRELVMSYFEDYFNTTAERTLRSFTRPMLLTDELYRGWRTAEEDLDPIGDLLEARIHVPLLTQVMESDLAPVDDLTLRAGFLGANPDGLYQPGSS